MTHKVLAAQRHEIDPLERLAFVPLKASRHLVSHRSSSCSESPDEIAFSPRELRLRSAGTIRAAIHITHGGACRSLTPTGTKARRPRRRDSAAQILEEETQPALLPARRDRSPADRSKRRRE